MKATTNSGENEQSNDADDHDMMTVLNKAQKNEIDHRLVLQSAHYSSIQPVEPIRSISHASTPRQSQWMKAGLLHPAVAE